MMNGMNNSSHSQNARSGLYPLEDILSAWLGILPTRSRPMTHWSGYVSLLVWVSPRWAGGGAWGKGGLGFTAHLLPLQPSLGQMNGNAWIHCLLCKIQLLWVQIKLLWNIYLCAMFGCFVPSGLAGVCGQRSKTQTKIFFYYGKISSCLILYFLFFRNRDFILYYVLCFPLYDSFNWYSIIIGYKWTDKSSRHLLQSSSCTSVWCECLLGPTSL